MKKGVASCIASDLATKLKGSGVASEVFKRIVSSSSKAFYFTSGDRIQAIALCEKRTWDTEFFKKNISNLSSYVVDREIRHQELVDCTRAAVHHEFNLGAECIFTRTKLNETAIVRANESLGFHLYDVGCRFVHEVKHRQNPEKSKVNEITFLDETDLEDAVALSSNIFQHDHFHRDSRIGKDKADEMYGVWLGNLFYDSEAHVYVWKHSRGIAGFVTIREIQDVYNKEKKWIIDLIGVSPEFRGKGIATDLVRRAILHAGDESDVTVSTQVSNTAAFQLYMQTGFRPLYFYATMHIWLDQT